MILEILCFLWPPLGQMRRDYDYLMERCYEQDMELADLRARHEAVVEAHDKMVGELSRARNGEIDALKRMADVMARAATGRAVFAVPSEEEQAQQAEAADRSVVSLPGMRQSVRANALKTLRERLDEMRRAHDARLAAEALQGQPEVNHATN